MPNEATKCVFNAETGLCNNCGGKGGTAGPCRGHSTAGGSNLVMERFVKARDASTAAHAATDKSEKHGATAADHEDAAEKHHAAADAHLAQNDFEKARRHRSYAEAHTRMMKQAPKKTTPTGNSSGEHYEELAFNFSGQKVRKVTLNGRSYTVAPMSLIVPGVLNGSKGRLYYPPEEVAKNPAIWNGRPLTLGHPYDPVTNEHLSAQHPGVLDRVGLGVVKNARWDGQKLRADGWFDDEHTRNKAPETWAALNSGQPFELSTGLFTSNEEIKGSYNGAQYDAIARNYRSDHVAVLMNERGACPMTAGCGVFNAADEGEDEDDSEIEEESDLEDEDEEEETPKKKTPAMNSEACIFNAETGLCMNCGGKGGKPGQCPQSRTASAEKASAKAEQSSVAMRHMQAANKHDAAEAAHREAGNVEQADKHKSASEHHSKRFNELHLAERRKKGLGGGSGSTLRGATQNSNQQETGSMDRQTMLSELTANCSCDKEKAALNELSDDTLKVLHNSKKKAPEPDKVVANSAAPAALTPDQVEVMNYGRDAMQRDKAVLVNRLVANMTDATQKAAMVTNLMQKGIPELRGLVSLLPPVTNQQNPQADLQPLFMGAGGGPDLLTTNRGGMNDVQEVKEGIDWPPTLNYGEMSAERATAKA